MEKINIAELLKDCPKGMELYSPIYGVGVLTKVTDRIHVKFPKEHNVKCFRLDGKVGEDGEVMIFPKGKTTWEGFVPPCKFKEGDRIKQIGSPRSYIIKTIEFDRYVLNNNQFVRFRDEHIYELVPNKFDITTLKPFESRVLMRDKNTEKWVAQFFSHYNNGSDRPYTCIGCEGLNEYIQCIPYEGNEHLLDTTNDCDEYYKTW